MKGIGQICHVPYVIIEKGILGWEIILWLGRSKFFCFFKHLIHCKSYVHCESLLTKDRPHTIWHYGLNKVLAVVWFNTSYEPIARIAEVYCVPFDANRLSATSPSLLNFYLMLYKIHEAHKWIWSISVHSVTLNRNFLSCYDDLITEV